MKRRLNTRGGRALTEYAVFVALYVPISFVFGWAYAGFVLIAAYFGFIGGKAREGTYAHRRGLDQGRAVAQLVQILAIEHMAGEQLSPDDPQRIEIAAERARLMKIVGLKPEDIRIDIEEENAA